LSSPDGASATTEKRAQCMQTGQGLSFFTYQSTLSSIRTAKDWPYTGTNGSVREGTPWFYTKRKKNENRCKPWNTSTA